MALCPYLEKLVDVVSDIAFSQGWVQGLKICVIDELKYQAGCFGLWISDHIQELDDVGAAKQVLQDLNLSFNLQDSSEG